MASTHTSYANPIGLDDPDNYSSAHDLVTLASILLRNPLFARIVNTPSATLHSGDHPRTVTSRNTLLGDVPWINGVKTGHTLGAGYVLVGSGTQDSTTLISAVLGAPDEATRDADTLTLLHYGFSLYHTVQPVHQGEQLADPKLDYRSDHLSLVAQRPLPLNVREGQRVTTHVSAPEEIGGAVRQGQVLGRVTVRVDGKVAAASPLVAARAVGAATTFDKAVSAAKSPFVLLGLAAIVILVGLLLTRRGRGSKEPEMATPRPRSEPAAGPPTADPGGAAQDARGENAQEAPENGAGGGHRMILTVTLNAAIDRTVAVPSFRQGHRHRAVEASTVAGGKGVNVARALKLLDRPVIATGLAGGPTGARLMERLAEESILTDFTWIAGESRTNLAVVDPTTGEQTEINERGPEVGGEELERFLKKLLYLARGARICAIAGSLPPSVPASFSARIVEELKAIGVETIVDTEGEPLVASLRAGPAAVTPNVREAEGAVGHEFNDREDALNGLRSLVELGATDAVITRPEGCLASMLGTEDQRHAYEVTAPEVEPVATVGSGDAFLAGFVAARYDGRPPEECLRFAVACGAESTQHFGAGSIDAARGRAPAARCRVAGARNAREGLGPQRAPVYRCYHRTGVGV